MDKHRIIRAVRFSLSLSFSVLLYSYFYIEWLISIVMKVGKIWDGILWLVFLSIWNFLVFLMSYFIFYNERIIERLIFGDIRGIKIFFSQVGKHVFLGSLLWGILGVRGYVMNAPAWIIMAPIGAFLGFIFGIISGVSLIVLRKRIKNRVGTELSTNTGRN